MNNRNAIEHDIKNIKLGTSGSRKKPHKLIFLLAVMAVQGIDPFENKIFLSEKLELEFKTLWHQHAPDIEYSPTFFYITFRLLGDDGFWKLSIRPEKEIKFNSYERITRKRMIECVEYGFFNSLWSQTLSDDEDRQFAKNMLIECLKQINCSPCIKRQRSECCDNTENHADSLCSSGEKRPKAAEIPAWSPASNEDMPNRAFISYVNSLHCLDANSQGALAEVQACNPMFHEIHVKHPWTDVLASSLLNSSDRSHVVLTGHAGDGKSTIALELCKILTGRTDQKSLSGGFPKRADVPGDISIIKDLSEWTIAEQDELLADMAAGSSRFFLVSNTGCLMNLFRRQASRLGNSPLEMEDELLAALESSDGARLATKAGPIAIYNLARYDNIDLALKMLDRLASSQRWETCRNCSFRQVCPVSENLRIFRQHKTLVAERLRLLLRRTTDYGSRMTMRQLSAHFAYMLTSGLSCEAVASVLRKKQTFRLEEHLFFNRFWGDNGWSKDARAGQLQSCRLIAKQGFGTVLAPSMERMLWQRQEAAALDLGVPELTDLIRRLLQIARKRSLDSRHAQARMQIRRMAYFFLEHSASQPQMDRFLSSFLNSPMLCVLQGWLKNSRQLDQKRHGLKEQLFHVLLEQFSGIRLPVGLSADATLHIALSRRQRGIRQNAQVLLGTIDFDDAFEVECLVKKDGSAELMLIGKKDELRHLAMRLDLPLLDYVAARQAGTIGSILQSSYANRLESLKASLLRHCSKPKPDELVLLKLDGAGRLQQLRLTMSDKGMEVANG